MATLTLVPSQAQGHTEVTVHPGVVLRLIPDTVYGQTWVDQIAAQQPIWLQFDPINGSSDSHLVDFPDLGNNVPIMLGFSARLWLEPVEPEVSE